MIILMRFGINKCKFEIMKDVNAAMTLNWKNDLKKFRL